MIPGQIRFLAFETVIELHRIAIEDQGGDPRLRDRGLLESAIAMPQQQFDGQYLHAGVPAMAAAYAFHICSNHPFFDGNKRAALAAMLAFLVDNGWKFEVPEEEAEQTIFTLAAGSLAKDDFTFWVQRSCREKPKFELRDLFRMLNPESLQSLKESIEQSSDPELGATLDEAAEAIPLIQERLIAAKKAEESGDVETASLAGGQAVLLVLIFRIAEDMGYEW